MHDLHERFDYPAVRDAVRSPDFDDLRHRARRRRVRRTGFAAGGVVALAVLAAAVTPTLLHPAPAPRTPAAAASEGRSFPAPAGSVMFSHVEFVDADRGYAYFLEFRPPRKGDGPACAEGVRVTDDGGETWSELRGMPCSPTRGFRVGAMALDRDTLLRPVSDKQGWISQDAGKTWTERRLRTRTAETFPDGVTPERVCGGADECADDNRLQWRDPATGDLVRLAKGPDLGTLRGTQRGTDGSVWVAGYTADGRYGVAVTRDNGRTWTTTAVDLKGEILEGPNVATYDGRVGYLVVAGPGADSDGNSYPHSIFRTDDGGATWHRVDTRSAPSQPFGVFEALVVPDGTLLIPTGEATWYASRDGGETFAPAEGFPKLDMVHSVPGRYWGGVVLVSGAMPVQETNTNDELYVSDDGLHWRKIDLH